MPAMAATTLQSVVDHTYQTNGRVDAILATGDTIYLGGKFTSVRPYGAPSGTGEVPRAHLAAINRATGALLPWSPTADKEVLALASSLDGKTIYVGGTFARIDGVARRRLAAVDALSGAIKGWAPQADKQVNTIAVTGTLIYFGGTFDTVNGQPRTRLAAADYNAVLNASWQPRADNRVRTIRPAPDGKSIFVGGDFRSINGDTAQKTLARLSPATGAPMAWRSHPGYPIHSLAFATTTLFAGGDGSGGHIGAYNINNGARLWTVQTDGGVQAVTIMNGVLYAGGHYDNVCAGVFTGPTTGFHCPTTQAVRHKLLAIDAVTGALDPWNPGANSPLGIFALDNAAGTLMVGGDFTKIGKPDRAGQATQHQQGYGQLSP